MSQKSSKTQTPNLGVFYSQKKVWLPVDDIIIREGELAMFRKSGTTKLPKLIDKCMLLAPSLTY